MLGQRNLEDLPLEELEKLLRIKRRQSRMTRFQELSHQGHSTAEALMGVEKSRQPEAAGAPPAVMQPLPTFKQKLLGQTNKDNSAKTPAKPRRKMMDRLLLGIEVTAVLTLLGVLISSFFSLQELNSEVSLAQQSVVQQQLAPTPTAVPPIALSRLPGGHSPPTSAEGAVPDVPLHLQQWVQPGHTDSAATIQVTSNSQSPTRIIIPTINVDAPIVPGVGWEDLKKGVGHLPGSANPGERGNLYLAAHNDIYGEIFRYLEKLEVGDEYFIHAGEQQFRYVVKQKRVILPTEVEVMLPTTEPVATLQTCYPYLIDTHRLVVIGELAE